MSMIQSTAGGGTLTELEAGLNGAKANTPMSPFVGLFAIVRLCVSYQRLHSNANHL